MRFVKYPAKSRVINNDIDRIFNTFMQPQKVKKISRPVVKSAAVNILETEDDFKLEVAIPGWNKEAVNIDLDKDVLTISAKKEETEKKEGENYLRREFSNTSLNRSFTLPETVNQNTISATFDAGILTIVLPKKEEAKPLPARKITIA